ncbi:MAG TPA: alpha/beta hydrolase [Microbacterium sp.]|nr:alpha/beta hydrolase [Microbacterium sp.]
MGKSTRPWYRRPSRLIPAIALGAGVAFGLAFVLTPWPAALLIRGVFERGADETVAEMEPYAENVSVDARLDLAYGDGRDEQFDLYRPKGAEGALPTVVWIHGGAWISGTRENVDPYVRILAAEGYTTVSLSYTFGPEGVYPTGLRQLNDALAYLVANADDLGIDPDRIAIAGDSAGANLTSQLATITTNPEYASEVGIEPALSPEQLRAVVLNCGIYDTSGIPDIPGLVGWGFRTALWAYIGERDWSSTAADKQMSTLDRVTADFPTTWISGGNGDPLTDVQSKPLAEKLEGLGVDVTKVFYEQDHEPSLPHEYQFHLDYEDARTALDSTLDFLGDALK